MAWGVAVSFGLHEEVTWRAHALLRTLADVHGIAEDIRGALDSHQFDFALISARHLSTEIAGITAMPAGGPRKWAAFEAGLCPYALASDDLRESTDELLRSVLRGDATVARRLVDQLVEVAEQVVGEGALPQLHDPDGMYSAMRLARELLQLMDDLALPSVLPDSWLSDGDKVVDD